MQGGHLVILMSLAEAVTSLALKFQVSFLLLLLLLLFLTRPM
jgi:hypothetical protein